ncbi:ring-cleaving dioxygenase [Paenibacillus methanolicus]|uniref:Glyoxalase family protein n=1 Tax=Paenibacillus methanolicus TaxID=582686 RepID=A0A5S5CFI5_9BACL|nr:ring-cleaving dioxygenase [Paenibacillus methanolicus]TYP78144.1 glyoxalase family protein [Paenibacillus methanolicus]
MTNRTAGIHHITAFARNPQENVDFYSGVLGLRLIKKTINFDNPHTYHLYFGDQAGMPGTIITFFPYPHARQGRVGGGQVGVTTFVIPQGAMTYWEERLALLGVNATNTERFGETYLQFSDPDGLRLELVERQEGAAAASTKGGIPAAMAIKGFGGAVLYSVDHASTMRTLEQVLGFVKVGEDANYARFQSTAELGNRVDVPLRDMEWGASGAGTVHHIAWRARDDQDHEQWRNIAIENGFKATPIVDRNYFKALYFRENGGILFEIATDPPGFARDEEPEKLGEKLMLPEWFEGQREEIEANLLPVTTVAPY